MKRAAAALCLLAAAVPAAERRAVVSARGAKPIGPYTPGIIAGDYLYVSGQGARDAEGRMPATFEEQVRLTLENVKGIVEAAGLTMRHVVYTQVYLDNMANLAAADRVYEEFFRASPPARATIGVGRMPAGTPVEINAVAVRDLSRKKTIAGGMLAGDRMYVAGVYGATPAEAMRKFTDALSRAGFMNNVVSVTAYTTGAVSGIFTDGLPLRPPVRVASLPGGASFELTGVAVRGARNPRHEDIGRSACDFAGDTAYCWARAERRPGENSGPADEQARAILDAIQAALKTGGMDLSDAVASNVWLGDVEEFARMNAAYAAYFGGMPPTRTTVQPALPAGPGVREIAIFAVRK